MKPNFYVTKHLELKKLFSERDNDWRMGGMVYQVFVDRFAPSLNLEQKKHLYQTPRTLQDWNTLPSAGKRDSSTLYYTHELAFWGGDLQSLMSKMNYIQSWGFTTLYLNPIFEALTNHKYDTYDYENVSKEYGNLDDLKACITLVHQSKMKIMLDGVFNHMAIGSAKFQDALTSNQSPYREWFEFDRTFNNGYRIWAGVPSLPELNLKNPAVRDYLFNSPSSIVQRYLKLGIDGWRLDTAIELGYEYLYELTESAHQAKQSSVVIGELLQFPQGWNPAMDGVMQLALRDLILGYVEQTISGSLMGRHVQQWIDQTGIDTMLKSWIVLENHDQWRIASRLENKGQYHLAKTLQFTLPGTVNLYQGEECGMEGKGDPYNRAPMRWDLVNDHNPFIQLHRQWTQLRLQERALRIGNFQVLNTQELLAFVRYTDQVKETLLIVINATDHDIEETLVIPLGILKSHLTWTNLLDSKTVIKSDNAFLRVRIKPQSSLLLKPVLNTVDGYSPYKNIL